MRDNPSEAVAIVLEANCIVAECAKFDPDAEQALVEEGLGADTSDWSAS